MSSRRRQLRRLGPFSQFLRWLVAVCVFALLLAAIARLPTSNAAFGSTSDTALSFAAPYTDDLHWMTGSTLNGSLVWWLDASDSATVFSDTGCTTAASSQGPIGCWKDRRPGHFSAISIQSPTFNTAAINGLNTVKFDGPAQMSGPNAYTTSTTSSTTIFIVKRENVRGKEFAFSLNGTVTANADRFTIHLPWSDGAYYFDPGDTSINRVGSPANFHPVGTTTLITAWKDPVAGRNYLDIDGSTFMSTGLSAATTAGGLNLGAFPPYYEPHLDYAEIMVFDQAMDQTERAKIATYLKNKWGTA